MSETELDAWLYKANERLNEKIGAELDVEEALAAVKRRAVADLQAVQQESRRRATSLAGDRDDRIIGAAALRVGSWPTAGGAVIAWSLLGALQQALTLPQLPSVLLVCWRWRYEIALVVGGPLLVYGLVEALRLDWAQVVLPVTTAMLVMWPPARRRVLAQCWCVLTQHRLRTGFARTWLHSRDGRLPAILWCTPTEHGEKVTLWCPAGLTVADVTARAEQLAAACYAIRIDAQAHPTHSHLVCIEVVRR